ncbi:transcriptional repressor [bacterium]|nr:transcriptional repressor [bacterium]
MQTELTDRFIKMARERKLKVTPQRVEIFRTLALSHEHPSAEQIHKDVREHLPAVSLDTVYRTLATLEQHGLIDRVNTSDDRARYEVHDHDHHHFVCVKCKEVYDVEWPEFDQLPLPAGVADLGLPMQPRVELKGICRKCQQQG